MSSAMYVCYECKTSRRYTAWTQTLKKCQFCGKTMGYVFHKIEMPTKGDKTGWKKFETFARQFNKSVSEHHYDRLKTLIGKLERQDKQIPRHDKQGHGRIANEIDAARKELIFWADYAS